MWSQVALLLTITGTYVVQAVAVATILARLFVAPGWGLLLPPVGLVALTGAVRAPLLWVRQRTAARADARFGSELRARLASTLLALGPAHPFKRRTGDLQAILVDGVEALGRYFTAHVPSVLASAIAVAGIVAYLFALDPVVGAIVLASALLVPAAPIVSQRAFGETAERFWAAFGRLGSEYVDALQGMPALKVFNASRRWGDRLSGASDDLAQDAAALTAISSMYVGFVAIGVAAGAVISVLVAAARLSGSSSPLLLFTILLLARECFRPLGDLQERLPEAAVAASAAETVLDLLEAPADAPASAAPAVHTEGRDLPQSVGFDHVSFAYRGGERPALRDVSFQVGAGETVAIVGRSGAGKTTVVSLLLRFFDPQAGRVLVGDVDVREQPLDRLRAMVAVVFQDTYLFHRTVRENLALGRPDATDEEIRAAARAAFADRFISELSQGYDTVLGERGMTLSGGERQRLAIARALLRDSPILVLDEATSSVDARSEELIQEALARLTEGRTTIVIAHRLSTIRRADRVIVLDGGRVIEEGRPGALAEGQGAYARLVAAQEAQR